MGSDQPADDLQRQVLQNTLDEIATRQEDATDCCVICLESIAEVCEAVPCQHRNFDYLCLLSWLEQSPKCPLCKAVISQVRHALDEPVAKTYTVPKSIPKAQTQQSDTRSYASSIRRQIPPRRHPYSHRSRYETLSLNPSDDIARRRDVYRHNRYSKHVGSNRLSRYRELTPAALCADNELVSRARMWIRRELQVFSFLNPDADAAESSGPADSSSRNIMHQRRANNAEFLLEYIIAVLKSVDIMGSAGQAEEMIADFLGKDNTRLFLHELRAWLRSPYTKLADWDRAVQYDTPTAGSARAGSEHGGMSSTGSRQDQQQAKPGHPVCPWCFIGALRLSRAITLYLKTVSSSDTIVIKWHAYQLNPNTPTQPLVSKIASQWGADQVPSVKARLNGIARREGLEFSFDSVIGNTRDAHRLEKLGRKVGCEMEVALEIMGMYFLEGGDITSKEDLAGAAERAGVDREMAREWLEGDDGGEEVDAEVLKMQRMGVKGVPRYIINGEFTVDGAEDVGDILEKLVLARDEAAEEPVDL
ncbi:hypothetical protein KAF25_000594 [Fusarium avenaceum]|uniref:RING-type E3 ubiquitin transferase n=1 Tax=Fusarium avenaceum TaxID=40199 RepID=A0A9P7H6L8_9HYPO|nr:hypothetical protein KAF25_000594 [Fusarium avenaceum]